jgi:uncharacterized protein (DUF1015 family)
VIFAASCTRFARPTPRNPMTRIRAFDGYVVNPVRARDVIAPAYDSMSPLERMCFSDGHPDSYLNVMRTREDYPGRDLCNSDILRRNRENLLRLLESGCFLPLDAPAMFIYRISQGNHHQTGVVAELPVEEIDRGKVLKHEQTRREREDLLVEYQEYVGATSSPVALAYRSDAAIAQLMSQVISAHAPFLDTLSDDGVRQTLWRVSDGRELDSLRNAFSRIPVTYLTDGHHRTASASRYVAKLREAGRTPPGDGGWNHVLVALFPHDELRILPFNRVVRDFGDCDEVEFLGRLRRVFDVRTLDADPDRPPLPECQGTFVMVIDQKCYRLHARDGLIDPNDPSGCLDVTLLERHILHPLLGIRDSRSDPRLEYVSGATGFAAVNRLRADGWRLAFYCHPATLQDIMKVSDAGLVMPPKSTSFEPKVRSGLFLRLNDTH